MHLPLPSSSSGAGSVGGNDEAEISGGGDSGCGVEEAIDKFEVGDGGDEDDELMSLVSMEDEDACECGGLSSVDGPRGWMGLSSTSASGLILNGAHNTSSSSLSGCESERSG